MTLQNRVLPDGRIVAHPARGTLTGNRGILHDANRQLGRARWRHPHWIACELSYKGWSRKVMSPGTWTELFFLDEAVALSAGHRPCALCRRADYRAFRDAWTRAFGARPAAAEIDRQLHSARIDPVTRVHAMHEEPLANLPDGSFIRQGGSDLLVLGDTLRPFAPDGYAPPVPRPARGRVAVLTPLPILDVLAAGYRPRLHPSAR